MKSSWHKKSSHCLSIQKPNQRFDLQEKTQSPCESVKSIEQQRCLATRPRRSARRWGRPMPPRCGLRAGGAMDPAWCHPRVEGLGKGEGAWCGNSSGNQRQIKKFSRRVFFSERRVKVKAAKNSPLNRTAIILHYFLFWRMINTSNSILSSCVFWIVGVTPPPLPRFVGPLFASTW